MFSVLFFSELRLKQNNVLIEGGITDYHNQFLYIFIYLGFGFENDSPDHALKT